MPARSSARSRHPNGDCPGEPGGPRAGGRLQRRLPPPLPLRQWGEDRGNEATQCPFPHSSPHRDELGGGASVSRAPTSRGAATRRRNRPGSAPGVFQDPPSGRGARLFRARRSPAGPLEGGPLRPPRRRRSSALQAPDAKWFSVRRNGPPVRRREGAVRQTPAVSRNRPGSAPRMVAFIEKRT